MAIDGVYYEHSEKLKYRQQYLRDIRNILTSFVQLKPKYLPVAELMDLLHIHNKHKQAVHQRLKRLREKNLLSDIFISVELPAPRQPHWLWNVKKITPHLKGFIDTAENVNQG